MNIAKFKDIVIDNTNNGTNLSATEMDLFNTKLKGKYAYVVNWKYVIPFDYISQATYVELSMSNNIPYVPYIDMMKLEPYMDNEVTLQESSIDKYVKYNSYTTDPDITVDELRNFRPWLAQRILPYNTNDTMISTMLNYYKFDDDINLTGPGMYDSTIKYLTMFKNENQVNRLSVFTKQSNSILGTSIYKQSSCGCASSPIQQTIGLGIGCDTVEEYRNNMYNVMVKTFSNYGFWMNMLNTGVLEDFRNYIRNIIRLNFPLYTSKYVDSYMDCGSLNKSNILQTTNMQILKNLENALTLMINEEVNGNKNFISDTLYNFAAKLYEQMYWGGVTNNVDKPTPGATGSTGSGGGGSTSDDPYWDVIEDEHTPEIDETLEDNTLQFATSPNPIFTNTNPFLMIDPSTKNNTNPLIINTNPYGVIKIEGQGNDTDPYKIKPISQGEVSINVSQTKSDKVNYIDITKKINIIESKPNPDAEDDELNWDVIVDPT